MPPVIAETELESGVVVTPLFDPTGKALELFRATAASVLGQRGVDFDWMISVQECHVSYSSILTELAQESNVLVKETQNVTDLHSHLTLLMQSQYEHNWMHLLCQDDRYSFSDSLRSIAVAMSGFDAILIRPILATDVSLPCESAELGFATSSHGNHPPRLHLEIHPPLPEIAGVNRFGGLSTIALRTSVASQIELSLDLLSDLELRRRVRDYSSLVGVLAGGLVTEIVWHGQAQRNLRTVHQEFNAWTDGASGNRYAALRCAAIAYAYGYPELGASWMLQVPAAGRILVPLMRLVGRLRAMLLASMSKGRPEVSN